MKTLILKASPNKDGNTAALADRFADGLRVVGRTDIVEFHLNDLAIRPCQACNGCFRPPYEGCVLDDDFQAIYPVFREADLVVFAAPIYWWHICAQMKAFVDRMHPMLTFGRDDSLPTKDLVLLTAYFAEDPYGVQLAVKTFDSIAGWAGMGFHVVRFHSAAGHVKDNAEKLAEAYELGRSYESWEAPALTESCVLDRCTFRFRSVEHAARHVVMAAGDDHLEWKAEHLSEIHTLQNTEALVEEVRQILVDRSA
jgi:putative NADPH-quinone reductase